MWIHVVVSYAINSQAICSSMDRLVVHKWFPSLSDQMRWMLITLTLSISSYLVANAIPFFQDLVAFIGALTTIPLAILLPAILAHKAFERGQYWIMPSISWNFSLIVFAIIFTIVGLIGSVSEIELDWSKHGPPFSCR